MLPWWWIWVFPRNLACRITTPTCFAAYGVQSKDTKSSFAEILILQCKPLLCGVRCSMVMAMVSRPLNTQGIPLDQTAVLWVKFRTYGNLAICNHGVKRSFYKDMAHSAKPVHKKAELHTFCRRKVVRYAAPNVIKRWIVNIAVTVFRFLHVTRH